MLKIIVGVGSAAMLLMGLLMIFLLGQFKDADSWRIHTYKVLDSSDMFLSTMKDAETGQRGYLLTGNKSYLEPFLDAQKQIPVQLDELRRLTKDNPDQQQRLARLTPLVDAKLSVMSQTLELYNSQHAKEAIEIVRSNSGKDLMDSIRVVVSDFNKMERRLLAQRESEYNSQLKNFLTTMAVLIVLAFLMIFIFASKARQEFRERLRIQAKEEEIIRNLAFYDTLTQLPNRRLLDDRLQQSLASSKRSGLYGALIFLDMDNFKPLNDLHGHLAGDALLVEVAHRLNACVRKVDTVARFGGDEFVVVLSELDVDKAKSTKQAGNIAEKIRDALGEPYLLKIHPEGQAEITIKHGCTSSIGVALFINHEGSAGEVLKQADMAMYQAKDAGRNSIRIYEPIA